MPDDNGNGGQHGSEEMPRPTLLRTLPSPKVLGADATPRDLLHAYMGIAAAYTHQWPALIGTLDKMAGEQRVTSSAVMSLREDVHGMIRRQEEILSAIRVLDESVTGCKTAAVAALIGVVDLHERLDRAAVPK